MNSLEQSRVVSILNTAFKQNGYRKGEQLKYYCFKCHHRKQKLEVCINECNGVAHCWTCNYSRSIINLLRDLNASHDSINEISKIYKNKTYIDINKLDDEKPLFLPKEFKPLWIPNKEYEYKHALYYCKKRGLTALDIMKYGIGYCSDGEFRGRIILPSYDENGQLNYYTGRSWDDSSNYKYMNAEASKDIIGFDVFINWNSVKTINLVEGCFDAMAIKQNTIPLFGKTISKKLMHKIYKKGIKRVNVLLDNDAKKDIIKMTDTLMNDGIEVGLHLFAEKDPSQIGFQKMTEIIRTINPCSFSDLMKLKLNL